MLNTDTQVKDIKKQKILTEKKSAKSNADLNEFLINLFVFNTSSS